MSRPVKLSTTLANLGISAAPAFYLVAQNADFMGVAATNGTGAPYYLKFYWTGSAEHHLFAAHRSDYECGLHDCSHHDD